MQTYEWIYILSIAAYMSIKDALLRPVFWHVWDKCGIYILIQTYEWIYILSIAAYMSTKDAFPHFMLRATDLLLLFTGL